MWYNPLIQYQACIDFAKFALGYDQQHNDTTLAGRPEQALRLYPRAQEPEALVLRRGLGTGGGQQDLQRCR